jgi:hypothetical protein
MDNFKVNETTPLSSVAQTSKTQAADDSFQFTLTSAIEDADLQTKVEQMLKDINLQGKLIARHMDIREMKKYRGLIRDFLNEIVNRSHKFSRENFLDHRGRHRVYGIIRLIDENLDELAQELVEEEKDPISILSRIGEIEGLLLDIFT